MKFVKDEYGYLPAENYKGIAKGSHQVCVMQAGSHIICFYRRMRFGSIHSLRFADTKRNWKYGVVSSHSEDEINFEKMSRSAIEKLIGQKIRWAEL